MDGAGCNLRRITRWSSTGGKTLWTLNYLTNRVVRPFESAMNAIAGFRPGLSTTYSPMPDMAGVNEVPASLLLAQKSKIPMPHSEGIGLLKHTDFALSAQKSILGYVNHPHEQFLEPTQSKAHIARRPPEFYLKRLEITKCWGRGISSIGRDMHSSHANTSKPLQA